MRRIPGRLGPALLLLVCGLLAGCAYPQAQESAQAPPGAPQGAIALDWEPPRERTDGTDLADRDIAGYRIYIGERTGQHFNVIEVADPQRTSLIIDELKPRQTYYIAIATVDRLGQESPKSREIHETALPLAEVEAALREHRARGADRRGRG